jgi:hypothetical protein
MFGRVVQFDRRKGSKVHESAWITGIFSKRDELLIAIPFAILFVVQFFRLDTVVATTRQPRPASRQFCGPNAAGDPILSDPDGRAVQIN